MVADMTGTRSGALAQALRERIALGDVGSTGALESEAVLGRRYGLSRVTVRRALEELRDQGLVESRPGAGWFVTGSSFHQTLALGTFRHAGSAVAEAGKSAARRVVEFAYTGPPATVAAALDVDADDEALSSRSVRTVDGEPLDLVHEWVPGGLAADISRADAEGAGIWATLQRQGHRIESVRQTITAAVTSDVGGRAARRTGRDARPARPAGRQGRRRHPSRALRAPLPGPPLQPRGRVPGVVDRGLPETPGLRSTDTTNDGETSA